MRNLIWPLWSMNIFTQSGWLILFIPDPFSGQHQIGESPPNTLFLRTFRKGQTYLLSVLFISSRITTPRGKPSNLWTSWVYTQGFPVEYELDKFNTPHTGTTLSHLQLWLCRLRCKITLRHPATSSLGNIFWRHASLPQQTGPHIHGWLHHSCP